MSLTKKHKIGIIAIAVLGCAGLLYAGTQTIAENKEQAGQPQLIKTENRVRPVFDPVREQVEEAKQEKEEEQVAKEEKQFAEEQAQAQAEAPVVQQIAPTPVPETVYTAPPTQEAVPSDGPKMGETKDGMIYVDGFGWIPDEGGGSQGTKSNMDPNGNKIGSME